MTTRSTLRLTGCKPDESLRTNVVIDAHIGFDFSAPTGVGSTGHIFCRDASSATFVEISIDLSSGRLCGATLIGSLQSGADVDFGLLKRLEGLPVFGDHGFQADAVMPSRDVKVMLSLAVGGDHMVFRLSTDKPDTVMGCGRAVFLFSDNCLVGVGATSLTAAEIRTARQNILAG